MKANEGCLKKLWAGSFLVLFGLGASVASMLSFLPWLVALSRHKVLTFSISGALIVCSFVNSYYILPRFRTPSQTAEIWGTENV